MVAFMSVMVGDLTVTAAAINLWILAAALGFDAIIGYPDALYRAIRHPVVWIGSLIRRLDMTLNRPDWRNSRRRAGGALAVLLLVVVCGGLAVAASAQIGRAAGRERVCPYG